MMYPGSASGRNRRESEASGAAGGIGEAGQGLGEAGSQVFSPFTPLAYLPCSELWLPLHREYPDHTHTASTDCVCGRERSALTSLHNARPLRERTSADRGVALQ